MIDADFKTVAISNFFYLPKNWSTAPKERVKRVFYSDLPVVAGIKNMTLANPTTLESRRDEAPGRFADRF
jgi:hypothetical protein